MSLPTSDPRIFFAAERTLLAWLRTGITIMAMGFVISRFGLFVQLLALQSKDSTDQPDLHISAILGVVFILIGAFAIIFSAIQQKRYINTLPFNDLPTGYSRGYAVTLSLITGFIGFALAGYLFTEM